MPAEDDVPLDDGGRTDEYSTIGVIREFGTE
jgi:hypothetical protein